MRRGFHVVASCGVVAGAGTILYEWDIGGKRVELVVKCYVNERRQMAVCTCLHVKNLAGTHPARSESRLSHLMPVMWYNKRHEI